jgi:hypothetical protein
LVVGCAVVQDHRLKGAKIGLVTIGQQNIQEPPSVATPTGPHISVRSGCTPLTRRPVGQGGASTKFDKLSFRQLWSGATS